MFALSPSETKEIDIQLEAKMDWAKTRSAEAEQLALDAARLLSCTEDRLDHIKKQGFFMRCCGRLTGKTGDMERANVNDLINMQKMGFRYINMLQEQQLMMAHSMLSLKNNLVALSVKEEETRNLIALLADKTLERFQSLESRVDQLEISNQLQGWILTLEDRDYEELYPQPFIRMLKVVNDFYMYKNDNWNYQDVLFMRKALRLVKIDPKTRITIKEFISCIVDDIEKCSFSNYESIVLCNCPENIPNFHNFAIENISAQSFTTIHGLATQYVDKSDVINMLSEELSISKSDALKRIFNKYIECLNVNLNCPLYLSDIALEILGGLRLSKRLSAEMDLPQKQEESTSIELQIDYSQDLIDNDNCCNSRKNEINIVDINSLATPRWTIQEIPFSIAKIYEFKDSWLLSTSDGNIFKTYDFDNYEDVTNIFPLLCEKKSKFRFDDKYFKFINEKWIKGLKYSDDCRKESEIDVQKICFQDDVSCRGNPCFYDGEKWCFFLEQVNCYNRTINGFFRNKKETRTFNSCVALTSLDFNSWNFYSSSIDYKYYEMLASCAEHKTLVASFFDTRYDSTDYILLLSKNGKEWNKMQLEDRCALIAPTSQGFALFLWDFVKVVDPDGLTLSISPKDYGLVSKISYQGVQSFQEKNLHISTSEECSFISNDCIDWKKIDLPIESGLLYFGADKFIAYKDNKIATWKVI